jgi:hypothetical protein
MENQVHNTFPKLNYFAHASRWLGVGSILPYILLGSLYYFYNKTDVLSKFGEVAFVIVIIGLLSGLVLGTMSLVTGTLAFKQIRNSQSREIGNRSVALGMMLGMLGIIVNILFCYLVSLSLYWTWAE